MFKKYYKEANDDIKTNRELINKIFETAEKPAKSVRMAKVYKLGTAVAAVFVLAAGAFLYPQIAKLNQQPQLPVETEQKLAEKTAEPVLENKVEQKTDEKASAPVVQQENPIPVQEETAPEIAAGGENPGIAVASETEDIQPFLIPEEPAGRMVDAPPAADVKEISTDAMEEITAEEATNVQDFLKSAFGEVDEETGNVYLFEIAGKAENMYMGRWRWLVDDHSSLLCEFVLNQEMTEMYECTYIETGAVQWNTQNNILDN